MESGSSRRLRIGRPAPAEAAPASFPLPVDLALGRLRRPDVLSEPLADTAKVFESGAAVDVIKLLPPLRH